MSVNRSILQQVCIFLIHSYQMILSTVFGGNCRFYPSCSEYAKECFVHHHPLVAVQLSTKRLCKCHPLGPSGYDPAPTGSKVK